MDRWGLLLCQCCLALLRWLKLQVGWLRNRAAPVFPLLFPETFVLPVGAASSRHRAIYPLLSSTSESSSCQVPPSSCVPCSPSLPLSFVPHPIPHHSHVSLTYFLVAFIALSSSTPHRVPRCYPAPSMLIFALPFLSFAGVAAPRSLRQLGRTPQGDGANKGEEEEDEAGEWHILLERVRLFLGCRQGTHHQMPWQRYDVQSALPVLAHAAVSMIPLSRDGGYRFASGMKPQ